MKKGYTLVELLVGIACASIVLASVTATIFFVSRSTNEVINNSEINYKLTNLRDYILDNRDVLIDKTITSESTSDDIKTYSESQFVFDEGKLYIKVEGVVKYTMSDTPISHIYYYKEIDSPYLRCMINYDRSNSLHDTYSFIVKDLGGN